MQHIANFLSARDLCAISWTCARNRAVCNSLDIWRISVRARFPHKIQQPTFIMRAPDYNMREFLFLLEDRARNSRAITHHARMRLSPEEVEISPMRAISCVSMDGIITDIIYVQQDSLILRGDIIHDASHDDRYFCIFDGVYARIQRTSISYNAKYSIELPITIKIGIEFDIDYFTELIDMFESAYIYIDTKCTGFVTCYHGADNFCELEYGDVHYIIRPAKSVNVDHFMSYASHTRARIVRKRPNGYELEFA
jgi:hypothetical protein